MACTFIPFCGFCCGCLSFVALLCTSTLLHPFLQTSPPFLLSPHLSPSLDASNTYCSQPAVYCSQPALGTSTFCVPTLHPALSGHPTMLPSPLLPTPGTPSPPVYLPCTVCCVPLLSKVFCCVCLCPALLTLVVASAFR